MSWLLNGLEERLEVEEEVAHGVHAVPHAAPLSCLVDELGEGLWEDQGLVAVQVDHEVVLHEVEVAPLAAASVVCW